MPAAARSAPIITLRVRWSAVVGLVVPMALALPAAAAGPKPVGTITVVGESGLAGIAIVAYQWTAKSTVTVGGGGSTVGRVVFDPFQVTKLVDATSPAFLNLVFRAAHLDVVRIDVSLRRGTTATYLIEDAIVTAAARRTADAGGASLETVSIEALKVTETVVSPGGTVSTCWSLKSNSACD